MLIEKPTLWEQQIKAQIRRRYAKQTVDGGLHINSAAKMRELGYPEKWIVQLPDYLVRRFSGCGCPLAELEICGDEIIIDLGAGAGIESYLAAHSLSKGRVISVDLTPEMLAVARQAIPQKCFTAIVADIERLPFQNQIADLIVANAAFNLTTNKFNAMSEAYRLLKPDGNLSICELVHDGPLPRDIIEDPIAHTSSLGGVISQKKLQETMELVGFKDIKISNVQKFSYVTSVSIYARRPV